MHTVLLLLKCCFFFLAVESVNATQKDYRSRFMLSRNDPVQCRKSNFQSIKYRLKILSKTESL